MQHNSRSGPINQAFYSIRWVHYIVSIFFTNWIFLSEEYLGGSKKEIGSS